MAFKIFGAVPNFLQNANFIIFLCITGKPLFSKIQIGFKKISIFKIDKIMVIWSFWLKAKIAKSDSREIFLNDHNFISFRDTKLLKSYLGFSHWGRSITMTRFLKSWSGNILWGRLLQKYSSYKMFPDQLFTISSCKIESPEYEKPKYCFKNFVSLKLIKLWYLKKKKISRLNIFSGNVL